MEKEKTLILAILSDIRLTENKEVSFSFNKIRYLLSLMDIEERELVDIIEEAYSFLIKIKLKIGSSKEYVKAVLFTKYFIDTKKETVCIRINEDLKDVLSILNKIITNNTDYLAETYFVETAGNTMFLEAKAFNFN